MPTYTTCDADVAAKDLFDSLTAGKDFALPAVDLTGAEFTIPSSTNNSLYDDVHRLTEADITTRTVGGEGLFDGLMVALDGQLKAQYDSGRITGKEYSTAYVALVQSAMASSVQYLLSKDSAYWQAQAAQKQARTAEILVVTARLDNEAAKAKLIAARVETNTVAANYSLSVMKLASEDAQYCAIKAQTAQTEYQNASLLPAQLTQLQKETSRLDYEIANLLPKELEKAQSQIDTATAQIAQISASKDQTLYQTASVLPAQVSSVNAETAVKTYQLSDLLPAQTAGFDADTAGKVYTNTNTLPAQLASINEQTEAHRSKTLDTRTDGTTVIAGAVGKQKALHAQQIDSYQRDAESKVVKMLLDTWTTQKAMDEDLPAPNQITDDYLNSAIIAIRTNLDLG